MKLALLLLAAKAADAQTYEYSLLDQNTRSASGGQLVGPAYYPGMITMHYFGHQS